MSLIKFVLRVIQYLRVRWWGLVEPIYARSQGVVVGNNVRFYGRPIIFLAPNSTIEIGEKCVICSAPEMTALGVNHPVVLRTIDTEASIHIGENTGISGATIVAAKHIRIGRECLIGANVTIVDTDFHTIAPLNRRLNSNKTEIGSAPIEIEDNVFIGMNSVILKGVKIGANSVVGAGSIVAKDVPRNAVVAGNPAKIIREL